MFSGELEVRNDLKLLGKAPHLIVLKASDEEAFRGPVDFTKHIQPGFDSIWPRMLW
jgi:hypothetical protein